jgi:GTP cyclohydrolase I
MKPQPFEYAPVTPLLSEPFHPRAMNLHTIKGGVRMILDGLGVDPGDHNFAATPERVAAVYAELFTPSETGWSVFDEDYTDLVMIRDHVFYTLCPHHLLPVRLTAAVSYIPNGKVIGASKLIRMVHEVNLYPMTQERLTAEIIASIEKLTQGTSRGEAVLLVGEHDCFRMRGVKSSASMVTVKFKGEYDTPERRGAFLDLVKL